MKSSKDVYFAVVEGNTLNPAPSELLCAAVLEYEDFILVGDCERLLTDLSSHLRCDSRNTPDMCLGSQQCSAADR